MLCGLFSSYGGQELLSIMVHRLLTVLASPIVEHGLEGSWASGVATHGLGSCGSWALEHRLKSCGTWA